MKYYAIKRPDGSWIMGSLSKWARVAWSYASYNDSRFHELWTETIPYREKSAQAAGYRCVEVSGFVEEKDAAAFQRAREAWCKIDSQLSRGGINDPGDILDQFFGVGEGEG